MNNQNIPSKGENNSLDFLNKFIEVQKEKVKNEQTEFRLREKELDYHMRHAKDILDAQIHDLDSQRKHNLKSQRNIIIVAIIVLLFFGAFIFGAFYFDKTNLIEDFFKVTIPALVTLFGGYHWGKNQSKKDNAEKLDE